MDPNQDELLEQIKSTLNSFTYPLTANHIAKLLHKNKSEINAKLYAKKNIDFEQLECTPPLWRQIQQ